MSRPPERLREIAARCVGYVAFVFHMAPERLFRASRGPGEESFARQVAQYVMHAGFDCTFEEVGIGWGVEGDPRHRSTVEHGVEWIEALCMDQPAFETAIDTMIARVKEGAELGEAYLAELMALRRAAPAEDADA